MAVIGLKVTSEPAVSKAQLAIQLAESIQNATNKQQDILAYQEQIRTERKKIANLKILATQVKEFRANLPEKVSRMEPLMLYDLEAMNSEMALYSQRITDWEETIAKCQKEIKAFQAETKRLQKELAARNKKE